MRKLLIAGAIALLAMAPAYAADTIILAHGWDMDGEGADVDQVVTAAQLVDSKDDYTIAASPDVCRAVDLTIVDADSSITAGTVTITGTNCLDEVHTATYAFAGAGSGVISASAGQNPYFKTVTKVENGVLTGEGGAADTMAVGYSTGTPDQQVAYGWYDRTNSGGGLKFIDVGARKSWGDKITTNGALTTSITEVTTDDDPFDYCPVNSLIFINIDGIQYTRKITTWTNDSNIVVNKNINIPAAGATFSCSKFYVSADPTDIMAIGVDGYKTVSFGWSVDANANTGGVVQAVDCTYGFDPDYPDGTWYEVATTTTASGSTQTPTDDNIDLRLAPFSQCRVTFAFGTTDDADAADEDINLSVNLNKIQE
jgi:hypothetical protein